MVVYKDCLVLRLLVPELIVILSQFIFILFYFLFFFFAPFQDEYLVGVLEGFILFDGMIITLYLFHGIDGGL